MKLIDADALDIVGAEVDKSTDAASFVKGMKHVIKQLNNAPTADAIPVVRCSQCKYFSKAKINKKGFLICPASGMEITNDDFCSYGKRKENK